MFSAILKGKKEGLYFNKFGFIIAWVMKVRLPNLHFIFVFECYPNVDSLGPKVNSARYKVGLQKAKGKKITLLRTNNNNIK